MVVCVVAFILYACVERWWSMQLKSNPDAASICNLMVLNKISVIALMADMTTSFTGLFSVSQYVDYVILACWIYVAVMAVISVVVKVARHRREMVSRVLALLAADLAAVLFITLASRLGDPTRGGLQLVPLLDIIQSARNGLVHPLEHALLNALLFVPTGCLVAQLGPRPLRRVELNFLTGLVLSIAIETIQLVVHLGLCDINDVLFNALGAAAGALLARFLPLDELWKMVD